MDIIKNGFKNERLGIELDVYVIDGKEWFKAQDVSEYLEYAETKDMTRNIDFIEENTYRHIMPTAQGNNYEAIFINEIALYEIICKIRKSNTERYNKAREFQKWVFEEVLPSLRKNNFYVDSENITKSQVDRLKDFLFDLCDIGKVSLGRASEKLFGNKQELKNRLVNLGWINYEDCTFKQQRFKTSRGDLYDLFVCNMSGVYENGEAKHQLQVSITNAGYIWLKGKFLQEPDFGL